MLIYDHFSYLLVDYVREERQKKVAYLAFYHRILLKKYVEDQDW